MKDLNLHPETSKPLEEKVGNTLQNIDVGYGFLEKTSKAKAIKTKTNKWDYIKLRHFCTAKETIIKVKEANNTMGEYLCTLHRR